MKNRCNGCVWRNAETCRVCNLEEELKKRKGQEIALRVSQICPVCNKRGLHIIESKELKNYPLGVSFYCVECKSFLDIGKKKIVFTPI